MRTVVGAMSGYCEIDSVKIASRPASMIVIAMTQAKIGRRMKNLAIGYSCAAETVTMRACGDYFAAGFCASPAAGCSAGTTTPVSLIFIGTGFTGMPEVIDCRPLTIS